MREKCPKIPGEAPLGRTAGRRLAGGGDRDRVLVQLVVPLQDLGRIARELPLQCLDQTHRQSGGAEPGGSRVAAGLAGARDLHLELE